MLPEKDAKRGLKNLLVEAGNEEAQHSWRGAISLSRVSWEHLPIRQGRSPSRIRVDCHQRQQGH